MPWYEVLLVVWQKKKSFAYSLFFCPIKSVSAGQMCKEDDRVNGVFIICAYMYTQTHRHHHHRNHHHHHHHHHNDCDDKQTSTRKRPLTLGYFSFLKCLKLDANEGFVCRGNLHKCTDNHPSSSAKTLGASQGPIMGRKTLVAKIVHPYYLLLMRVPQSLIHLKLNKITRVLSKTDLLTTFALRRFIGVL